MVGHVWHYQAGYWTMHIVCEWYFWASQLDLNMFSVVCPLVPSNVQFLLFIISHLENYWVENQNDDSCLCTSTSPVLVFICLGNKLGKVLEDQISHPQLIQILFKLQVPWILDLNIYLPRSWHLQHHEGVLEHQFWTPVQTLESGTRMQTSILNLSKKMLIQNINWSVLKWWFTLGLASQIKNT